MENTICIASQWNLKLKLTKYSINTHTKNTLSYMCDLHSFPEIQSQNIAWFTNEVSLCQV